MQKEISQTTIDLFDFAWLDTSAISIINFGSQKKVYHTQAVREYPG